jgi:hypothetical protein
LTAFDRRALARLQLHQEHDERADVRPMAIHNQPGIGLLCWRLITAGATLGCRFFLAANLHALQSFQAQQFQALLEGAAGQGGQAQTALHLGGVSAARIGQFS